MDGYSKIPDSDLELLVVGNTRVERVYLIRHGSSSDKVELVPNTRILLLGEGTRQRLTRLILDHGRPWWNENVAYPFPSSTYTKLRSYLLDN